MDKWINGPRSKLILFSLLLSSPLLSSPLLSSSLLFSPLLSSFLLFSSLFLCLISCILLASRYQCTRSLIWRFTVCFLSFFLLAWAWRVCVRAWGFGFGELGWNRMGCVGMGSISLSTCFLDNLCCSWLVR
ncbi:hypothetical protein BO71DRAFT_198307 [Aspergillus ellipticus CBS 707.79]|uniref:Transmembrane protein n=1 Tax=Aspergillus ellipticus CBS 707.79 TaxID=1448320 RepID=A0A319DNZ8_9EURO|nr:hypothetical protein BO71DRAFT_198307 [Aspergillus ellipticus CBS 707.79]